MRINTHHTLESKQKISIAIKLIMQSLENRQRISEALTNNKFTSKVVGMFDLAGNLLRVFPSTQQAHRDLGYSNGMISKACRGIIKTYKGCIWRYL